MFELLPIFYFRYLGKMKAEVQKILKLYEELEAAGETATLTFSTSGDKSIVKLQLQPPSLLTSSPSSQLLLQHQFLASVDGSSSPPPSRPPPPGFSTLGLRPPFNGTPTATPHHCLDCGRCPGLCVAHHGCYCSPDKEECGDWCVVCNCDREVRWQS